MCHILIFKVIQTNECYFRELLEGIPVYDANGNRLGESKIAAEKAISLVVVSRICMAIPGMCKFIKIILITIYGIKQ